jgi:hypothetical protein
MRALATVLLLALGVQAHAHNCPPPKDMTQTRGARELRVSAGTRAALIHDGQTVWTVDLPAEARELFMAEDGRVAIVTDDGWSSVLDYGPDGALIGRLGLADIFTEGERKKLIQKCGYWWRSKVTTTLDGETLTIVVTGKHPRTLRLDLSSARVTTKR